MLWSKMGFAKERKHPRFRMRPANLRDLRCGMAIARTDLAHVTARLQINAIYRTAMLPVLAQQTSERLPVISPFIVVTNARPKFVFTDFAAQPFVEKILIAAEGHLQRQHNWAITLR